MTITTLACKQRYTPPVASTNKHYLVVDGVIVPGNDSTIIKLSRVANLNDTALSQPETGAQVTVIGEGGDAHPLLEQKKGQYVSTGLNLSTNQEYQLKITTASGIQYQSDLVEVKQTPPIDSVGWYQDSNKNVVINVSTHDPGNDTKYYRWEYTETWIHHAPYHTYFDWVDGTAVTRGPENQVYYCWPTKNSSGISIASTARQSQAVIYRQPIAQVENSSEKIGIKYSIIARQYGLTKDAYEFWSELKKSTEQLGTLFDPQPGELPTNIHCLSNPGEVVVGYVSVSSIQTKRIFIGRDEVSYWFYEPYYTSYAKDCTQRVVPADSMKYFFPPGRDGGYTLYGAVTGGGGYIITRSICADCRTHGGSNIQPPFWP